MVVRWVVMDVVVALGCDGRGKFDGPFDVDDQFDDGRIDFHGEGWLDLCVVLWVVMDEAILIAISTLTINLTAFGAMFAALISGG